MAKIHRVAGAAGVLLHVREFGNPRGIPLVLIHGWTQGSLCWARQYHSALANEFRIICPDLRGHGQSEKPAGEAPYTDPALWAGDVHAVVTALELDRPVLAGWSYGSLVAGMYLRHYGDSALGGINFVGPGVRVAPELIGTLLGSVFLDVLPKVVSEDLDEQIDGIRQFLRACLVAPVSREDWESALCFNIVVPPAVRGALLAQPVDITPDVSRMTRPALLSHGLSDAITLPAMGQLLLAHCPTAKASWYEGVGHAPFLEAPDRFNRELAAFARSTRI